MKRVPSGSRKACGASIRYMRRRYSSASGTLSPASSAAYRRMSAAWNRLSTSSRSNVRPASSAIEVGLGSAGSNSVWLTLMPMPATVRASRPPARMLNEDTHQFAIAGVDVVRPFDAGIDSAGAEGVDQRERHGLREQELLACGKERRTEHDRKEKVHPFGTRPCMSPLPASRRLPFGADHVAVAVTFFTREVVGRSRLRNMIDHGEIENLSVRSSARPKRCMPPFTPQRRNRAARR